MNKTVFSITTVILLAIACVASGYFLARSESRTGEQENPVATSRLEGPSRELEELLLKADTATSGNKIAMATASIDGNVDVIFTLDYESGNLFAWLPGPNGWLGEWSTNVAKAVGLEKGSNPDLVLSVGNFNVRHGNSGGVRDAPLIVYVANGDNGQVAGFGFQWNPQAAKTGTFQRNVLVPAYQGSTREQTLKRQ
ncbi:MAG: hypothetical protein VX768_10905 [Planctomycetota bacterium]|nr:hypothetical protein [Planctomycetota bacterium]